MFFNGFGGGHPGMGGGGGRRQQPEVDNSKFYNTLGIEKTADASEIKKAYRKMAMTHHPDKGGDAEKFKEITRAYEVLSDPEKKQLYDEGGEEALDGSGGGGGAAGMDIFDLFGGGMFGGHGGRGRGGKKRGEDVVFPLKVTLEDLYNGTSKKLRLTKNILCKDCGGKGGKVDATCKDCKGQGVRLVIRQLGPGMIQQAQVACQACRGTGSTMLEKDKCKKCRGDKTVKEKKTLEVFVSKGMKDGERITFNGEGDEAPDTIPGDVVVVLKAQEHPTFRREGPNIFMKKTITLFEALTGFQFLTTHLDGRNLLIRSEAGGIVKPGDVKKIPNEGFPIHKSYNKGNLYVEFDVAFPAPGSVTPEHKQLLAAVLPQPAVDPAIAIAIQKSHAGPAPPASTNGEAPMETNDHILEEVTLTSVNLADERRYFHQQQQQEHEAHDDDDDGHHRGGQPGCRTQ